MAQTKQLETIVRREKKDVFPRQKAEKRIIIDNKTGAAVPNTSIFGSYTFYIVSNSVGTPVANFGSSMFPVTDDLNRKINISFDCRVSCGPGNESKVAESLHLPDKYPGNVLDDLFEIWVSEFVKQQGPAAFIDTFFQNRGNLEAYIAKCANAQTGLNFEAVHCLLDGENDLATIHTILTDVALRYADSIAEHSYSLDASLLIDPRNKINVIARNIRKSGFEEMIRKVLQEYFFNKVSISTVYKTREKVENDFKIHLERLLAYYGRQIGAIQLKKLTPWEPDETLEDFVTVSINVPEYPKPVAVENRIFITRVDPAKFNANKPDDLRKWLNENVQNVVKQVFFGRRYDEIIESSKELEIKVKNNLKILVERIGYNLDQIIIIPSFDELKILEKLEIDVDGEFITRDHQKVKLEVSIKAVGDRQSKKLKRFVNNISILPAEMKGLVENEIIKYVHTIRSDEFYENFDDEENPAGTVKYEITQLIVNKLTQVFDATTQYISFDIGETEIIKVMDDLKKEWHKFEFEIGSLSDGNNNAFSAWFRVKDNAWGRWNIFQSQRFTISEIKERIVESLISKLSKRVSTELTYKSDQDGDEVERQIREIAENAIEESFGLRIIIRDVHRKKTLAETTYDDFHKFFQEKVKSLLMSKMEAFADGDFEGAEEFQRRIDGLNESAGNNRISLAVDEKAMITAKAGEQNGTAPSDENKQDSDN